MCASVTQVAGSEPMVTSTLSAHSCADLQMIDAGAPFGFLFCGLLAVLVHLHVDVSGAATVAFTVVHQHRGSTALQQETLVALLDRMLEIGVRVNTEPCAPCQWLHAE